MIDDVLRRLSDAVAGDGRFLLVLAGSNGAGKSTFHDLYVRPLGLAFVNADLIARDLGIADPVARARRAGEVAEDERRSLLARGESFCMETVFSDPVGAKLGLLRDARRAGYEVVLLFIGIDGPDLSLLRVAQRVAQGGHDVPDDRLRARFPRTLENLKRAIGEVDMALLLDNSDAERPFRTVARYERGARVSRLRRLPPWAKGVVT
ncbi:MAG: hypothetical protein JNL07_02580 [Rhodospirillales bacterium]|nr:hypothetical protein [Rhodospirillales bacterium]